MGASAFEVGIMTQPLAFRAWRPWSGAFETHSADRPQWSSTVAACFAPAARTPEVLPGINAALAATAAIGVLGGAVALARNSIGSNRCDSSVSDSSVSEGAPVGVC